MNIFRKIVDWQSCAFFDKVALYRRNLCFDLFVENGRFEIRQTDFVVEQQICRAALSVLVFDFRSGFRNVPRFPDSLGDLFVRFAAVDVCLAVVIGNVKIRV